MCIRDRPELKLAILAESDVTGRRVAHRVARPRARPTDGFFDDLAPGSYVVHRQHGVARYAGVTTRVIGDVYKRQPNGRALNRPSPVPLGQSVGGRGRVGPWS